MAGPAFPRGQRIPRERAGLPPPPTEGSGERGRSRREGGGAAPGSRSSGAPCGPAGGAAAPRRRAGAGGRAARGRRRPAAAAPRPRVRHGPPGQEHGLLPDTDPSPPASRRRTRSAPDTKHARSRGAGSSLAASSRHCPSAWLTTGPARPARPSRAETQPRAFPASLAAACPTGFDTGLHTGSARSTGLALSPWPAARRAPVPDTRQQGTHARQREGPPGQPAPHMDYRSHWAPAPSGNTGTDTALFTLSLTCTLSLTKWRFLWRGKPRIQHSPVKVHHNLLPRSSLQSPPMPFSFRESTQASGDRTFQLVPSRQISSHGSEKKVAQRNFQQHSLPRDAMP